MSNAFGEKCIVYIDNFKISRVFTVYRRAEQARVQEGVYDTIDLSLWKLYLKFVPDLINFYFNHNLKNSK